MPPIRDRSDYLSNKRPFPPNIMYSYKQIDIYYTFLS